MYMSLLAQAIREEQGESEAIPEKECLIDLQIDAHIPDTYIESLPQRLSMYRRIADIRNKNDAYDVIDELTDRFGSPPESVQGLITVACCAAVQLSTVFTKSANAPTVCCFIPMILTLKRLTAW